MGTFFGTGAPGAQYDYHAGLIKRGKKQGKAALRTGGCGSKIMAGCVIKYAKSCGGRKILSA